MGWRIFVEQPLEEVFAPLYESLRRTGLLLLGGLGLSLLASVFLARRMVGPIQAVQAGAARIGAGNLNQAISPMSPSGKVTGFRRTAPLEMRPQPTPEGVGGVGGSGSRAASADPVSAGTRIGGRPGGFSVRFRLHGDFHAPSVVNAANAHRSQRTRFAASQSCLLYTSPSPRD